MFDFVLGLFLGVLFVFHFFRIIFAFLGFLSSILKLLYSIVPFAFLRIYKVVEVFYGCRFNAHNLFLYDSGVNSLHRRYTFGTVTVDRRILYLCSRLGRIDQLCRQNDRLPDRGRCLFVGIVFIIRVGRYRARLCAVRVYGFFDFFDNSSVGIKAPVGIGNRCCTVVIRCRAASDEFSALCVKAVLVFYCFGFSLLVRRFILIGGHLSVCVIGTAFRRA